jgi:hypothetical protein
MGAKSILYLGIGIIGFSVIIGKLYRFTFPLALVGTLLFVVLYSLLPHDFSVSALVYTFAGIVYFPVVHILTGGIIYIVLLFANIEQNSLIGFQKAIKKDLFTRWFLGHEVFMVATPILTLFYSWPDFENPVLSKNILQNNFLPLRTLLILLPSLSLILTFNKCTTWFYNRYSISSDV